MTKTLRSAFVALGVVLVLTGSAFAQGTAHAETTWVYSHLCQAAVPVSSVEGQRDVIAAPKMTQGMPASMDTSRANLDAKKYDEGHPVTGVAVF